MLLSTLALLFAPAALAALEVTQPSSDIWWVNESQNVVAWSGEAPPADFVTWLTNPDIKLLTADTPLASTTQTYMRSLAVPATKYNVGKGYVIKLADTLNATNVYATSSPFEIKPLGAEYPTVAVTAASTASGSQSGTGAAPSGAATASDKPDNAAGRTAAPAVAIAAAGALAYIMA